MDCGVIVWSRETDRTVGETWKTNGAAEGLLELSTFPGFPPLPIGRLVRFGAIYSYPIAISDVLNDLPFQRNANRAIW